ncbi:SDR family oxidoreductase [Xanthobacter dioxanivorans]|uniref:SDR family oxidoreductase n=2 Tax=Xanthobacter dioxanivorans TaxID=2528964 RepID=A0A974SL80_9HYPH|nr:SDR family oxidoreductase [Xanthobacter dioxanivorans]
MNFKDKIVVVTGAASGIGHACARAFAEAGARVALTDVNVPAGEAAAGAVQATGDVRFLPLDVTDRASAAALAARIEAEFGRLDVLVNAAGWDIIQPFMENSPEYWEKIVALNFMGPVQVTRALLPLLFASGSGRIVNVASDAGRVGSYGETVYAGAKGGIIAFTKSLAREVVRKQVRVNCICPGPTDTPLFASQSDKMREALTNAIPMKRVAQPSEIADAVLYFASDRSSFITGQVLSVSGGLTMVG